MREQIGIFGGTFDPPHLAHLIAAEFALDELSLEKILFVPAFVAPHKTQQTFSSGQDRLAMTKLAIQSNSRFEVSEVEIDRGTTSYSIDTLRALKLHNPNADFSLIIGFDNLLTFTSWKDYAQLLDEATVVAIARPAFDASDVPTEILSRVNILSMPHLAISSSMIRGRVREGRSIRYYVPDAVGSYIAERKLYL